MSHEMALTPVGVAIMKVEPGAPPVVQEANRVVEEASVKNGAERTRADPATASACIDGGFEHGNSASGPTPRVTGTSGDPNGVTHGSAVQFDGNVEGSHRPARGCREGNTSANGKSAYNGVAFPVELEAAKHKAANAASAMKRDMANGRLTMCSRPSILHESWPLVRENLRVVLLQSKDIAFHFKWLRSLHVHYFANQQFS